MVLPFNKYEERPKYLDKEEISIGFSQNRKHEIQKYTRLRSNGIDPLVIAANLDFENDVLIKSKIPNL